MLNGRGHEELARMALVNPNIGLNSEVQNKGLTGGDFQYWVRLDDVSPLKPTKLFFNSILRFSYCF